MSNQIVLITQPDFDRTTRYISSWSEFVEEFSVKRGNDTITLKGKRANRFEFESVTKKTQPQLIMLNGHGNDSEVAGQDNETLLTTNSVDEVVKGRIIYALSCSAAKKLGHDCVKKGALAFFGYTQDYIFLHNHPKVSRPKEDKRAELFFGPSNLIPISLIKGNNVKNSYQGSKDLLRKNILDLLNSETYNEDRICLPYLIWNYQNLVYLGDENAKL